MTEREDDGVQVVEPRTVLQPDALRPAGHAVCVGHRDRPRPVHMDRHMGGCVGDHVPEPVGQIAAVEGTGRVGVRSQHTGLGEGRRLDGSRPAFTVVGLPAVPAVVGPGGLDQLLGPVVEARTRLDRPVDL